MQIKQSIQNQAEDHGTFVLKAMSFHFLSLLMAGSQSLIFLISSKLSLFPGVEAMASIVSTCAQIIAGLYGITTAGYTFFLSRIDALMASDKTLDYIVISIKNRFKHLIWYITFSVMMTLMFSIVLMYSPMPEGDTFGFIYRLFCNEFILFVAFSIALILVYSLLVIDPNCIQKEARKLKRRLGGGHRIPGNVAEFITLYDQIEERCNAMLPQSVLHQLHENKGKHFELTLELLKEQHLILFPVVQDLIRIHRYYECMINAVPMSVSMDMCLLARKVLSYLDQISSKAAVKL